MRRKTEMPKTLQIGDVTVPGQVLLAPMTGDTDLPWVDVAIRIEELRQRCQRRGVEPEPRQRF